MVIINIIITYFISIVVKSTVIIIVLELNDQ